MDTINPEQIETDSIDDSIVYFWVTKNSFENSDSYYFSIPYSTKEEAEQKGSYYMKDKLSALIKIDLSGIKFTKGKR